MATLWMLAVLPAGQLSSNQSSQLGFRIQERIRGGAPMTYQPIENYGIIGNMRTVALVGMNGSVDWYCYPTSTRRAMFGAILDDNKAGRFQICAVGDQVRHKQFYWPSTNILVTRFSLPDGIAELR
jgi:GH15 family glucan-1,4-alpha-glucosidase